MEKKRMQLETMGETIQAGIVIHVKSRVGA